MKSLLLAGTAALLAWPAGAQPPPEGWVGEFSPSILCDTRAQLQSIVNAFGDGPEAGHERFAELFQRMNPQREPTCALVTIHATVAESTNLGAIDLGKGEVNAWSVRVANDTGEGFYLYLESRMEALRNSI